jgi:hypothetical protein
MELEHMDAQSTPCSSTVKVNESVTDTYVGVAAKTMDWPPIVQEKKKKKRDNKKKAEVAAGKEKECPSVVWWYGGAGAGGVCVILSCAIIK